MHVQLFIVCTELMLSVHGADCEPATQPYSSGGRGTIFPDSKPAECYHTGNKTTHRQDNSPTRFLRQFTDRF